MGSLVLDHHLRSDQVYNSPYTMLEGTVGNQAANPSDSVSRSSTSSTRPTSQLESGFSRSLSSNNAPASSTAPPSAASAQQSSHDDAPTYTERKDNNNNNNNSNNSVSNNSNPSQPHHSLSSASSQPVTRASSNISASASAHSSMSTASPYTSNVSHVAPHPPSEKAHPSQSAAVSGSQTSNTPGAMSHDGYQMPPPSPQLRPTFRSLCSLNGSEATSPSRIKVRDLSHIQSFASEKFLAQTQHQQGQTSSQEHHYEISSMPVTDIIQMVAAILTKIAATNDKHHEHIHRHIPPPDGTSLSPQAASVLAFHGKNVPSITIYSYLCRIHKYCPTTYEVFLSLLVYFDRMTEVVNRDHLARLRRRSSSATGTQQDAPPRPASTDSMDVKHEPTSPMVTPPSSEKLVAQDLKAPASSVSPPLDPQDGADSLSRFFVVDSFNIHRLVIAGVTCGSKFFSDVFYTNSRYAKVGGLPLLELNHLELQFLLLNEFRLAITVEELEAYGTMLVEFYAREIVKQKQKQLQQMAIPPSVHQISGHSGTRPRDIYTRPRDHRSISQPQTYQTPTPP